MIKAPIGLLAVSLATMALLSVSAHAQTRIGVTSGASGDPLGKPPAQAERVLHVGVDVQANELVTTGASDRAHLLFLDGSSLTVGPQARLTIDRLVYDPNRKAGDLAITATQGVFRFVGGKISKTTPVTVNTPSGSLTIRGGIMIVRVEPNRTVATFVFGIEMVVKANGKTESVKRPGWQVTLLSGQAPGKPVQAPSGSLAPELGQLEALQAQPGSGNADQRVQSSGFADQNSGRGVGVSEPGSDPTLGGAAGNSINGAGNQLQKPFASSPATAVTGSGGQRRSTGP